MLWGHPVDIVAPHGLQLQHHGGQLLRPHLKARLLLADVIVLTEHTAQVAPGKEDGTAALPAAQAVLLAKVRKVAGHAGVAAGATDLRLVLQPVDLAVPGAYAAALQARQGTLDAPLQLARLVESDVVGHLMRYS